jgi:hypothetical protein
MNNFKKNHVFIFVILDLNDVEEKLAHKVGGGRVGLL